MIVFDVLGTPAPKGSGRAIMVGRGKGAHAVHVPSGSDANKVALAGWDRAVQAAARAACGQRGGPVYVDTPLEVAIIFRLRRPAGHYSKRPGGGLLPSADVAPIVKPDVDKLTRSTLDSLTGIVYDDDAKIVRIAIEKEYAAPGNEGARVFVEAWKECR